MLNVGLTGQPGAGKSTVAAMFTALGVPVFDADAVVHELYGPQGEGAAAVAALFPQVLENDGSVDRARLAALVATDADAMKRLEAAIHPLVTERRRRFSGKMRAQGHDYALHEIPLLFETGMDADMDRIVLVMAPADIRRRRLRERGAAAYLQELERRLLPEAEKADRADFLIDNAGSLEDTRRQVMDIHRRLRALTR